MVLVVKNLPDGAGDIRDVDLIPDWGRSPGEGHGNPLQHSCLENPTDGGGWQAAVHGVTKSQTQPSDSTTIQNKKPKQKMKMVTPSTGRKGERIEAMWLDEDWQGPSFHVG